MPVKFCPVASGSNGNSIYIGTENTHLLIDAGLSGKRIQTGLKTINVDGSMLDAIFITHEHSDHISGAGILSRRFDIPVYATEKTWQVLDHNDLIGKVAPKNKCFIYNEEDCIVNDIRIRPFQIPHDAADPVGYTIFTEKYKISVVTDIGHASCTIKENICDSDILLLESNHDIEMLKSSSYPMQLKRRILGDKGHLSNAGCGKLITEIFSKKLKHVYLGHLSGENNRPIIALETVKSILTNQKINIGVDLNLFISDRGKVGNVTFLE